MTPKTAITTLPDVTASEANQHATGKTARSDGANTDRVHRTLWLELLSATCEPERAVLRCAMSILHGAQAFEIDPVTGNCYTVAGFERAAASWAEECASYDRKDDAEANPYRHDLVMEGRAVQARYAAVHPHLAEPVWFPNHGPHNCLYCLMEANEAAGLPVETGMDPVTGGIAKPGPTEPVAAMLPGMEDAA